MNYKEKIIEMVQRVEDEWVLEFVYHFVRLYLKKWGI